jgi:hypothetical protein
VNELLHTLRQTRDALAERGDEVVERGTKLADTVLDTVLDTVQSGALDWRRTVSARREALDERGGWFRFIGLQTRVLNETERLLDQLATRLREQLDRLRNLELAAAHVPPAELPEGATAEADGAAEPEPAPPATEVRAGESPAEAEATESETAKRAAETLAAETLAASDAKLDGERAKLNGAAGTKPPTARRKKASRAKPLGDSSPPKRFVLPINGYGDLTAKDILAELPRLTSAQCKVIRDFERVNKNRKTVLSALDARIAP